MKPLVIDSDVLLKSLSTLTSELDLNSLERKVLELSLHLTGADRAILMLYDESGQMISRAGRHRKSGELVASKMNVSQSVIRKVRAKNESIYIPLLKKNKEFEGSESARLLKLKSIICIPLSQSKSATDPARLTGILYIDSASVLNRLKKEHLSIMQMMAEHIAIAIQHSSLFQSLQEQKQKVEFLNKQLKQRLEVERGTSTELKILLEQARPDEARHVHGNLIGKSEAMQKIFHIIDNVTKTNATVLIEGETGTGKEVVARYIHFNGPRMDYPLVSVNCCQLSETLLESELFGHTRGAFTGAHESKKGLFEFANHGTLFLDEIGDMNLEMQKRLLRVLENGEVRPVGGKETHKVDVRIIAATNKDLYKLVGENKFREDLYYRLNVIRIPLPPLRERKDDIPLLVDFFSRMISEELQRDLQTIPQTLLTEYMKRNWPGNVRELQNELRRFYILNESALVQANLGAAPNDHLSKMEQMEKVAIRNAMKEAGGNVSRAAEILGMHRSTVHEKLKKYTLPKE